MNAFQRHGLEHLSPSSINLFAAAPAVFVLEKVLKRRQPVGAAAHRGNAVESGIAHGLSTGASMDECKALAEGEFRRRTAMSGDPRKVKEGEGIADMVAVGLTELMGYGLPSRMQGRVEHKVEGLAVPIIGFFDFAWDSSGILLDLKTTHRIPSQISTSHARQVALYRAAMGDNLEARVSYVSTKKAVTYGLENAREHIAALEKIALTIQRFLAISNDPHELAGIVVPDVDSYFLADPAARQAAFDQWGF
jgi:hypothetical protein